MTCNGTAPSERPAAKVVPFVLGLPTYGKIAEHFGYDGGGKVVCEVLLGAGFSMRDS
jgi:hypothetical protein